MVKQRLRDGVRRSGQEVGNEAGHISGPPAGMVERLLFEIEQQGGMTVADVAARAHTHRVTVTRWCKTGVPVAGGRRVRLEAVRVGAKLLTSAAAYARFVTAQTPAPDAADSAPRTPTQRQRASQAADAELAELGL